MNRITQDHIEAACHASKTIIGPRESITKWVEALRSGEYLQARGALSNPVVNPDTGAFVAGYCCLGVLQMALDGKCELDEATGETIALPNKAWLAQHDIHFGQQVGMPWPQQSPYLTKLGMDAHVANDGESYTGEGRHSFSQIADAIMDASYFID